MSDFLGKLVGESLGDAPEIVPLRASTFEPMELGLEMTFGPSPDSLEQDVHIEPALTRTPPPRRGRHVPKEDAEPRTEHRGRLDVADLAPPESSPQPMRVFPAMTPDASIDPDTPAAPRGDSEGKDGDRPSASVPSGGDQTPPADVTSVAVTPIATSPREEPDGGEVTGRILMTRPSPFAREASFETVNPDPPRRVSPGSRIRVTAPLETLARREPDGPRDDTVHTYPPTFRPATGDAMPTIGPSRRQPAPAGPEPVVRVTIGRVEVRATTASPAPPPRRTDGPHVMSLQDYLRRRARGGGR